VQQDQVDRLIASIPDRLSPVEAQTIGLVKRISILDRILHEAVNDVLADIGLTHADFEVLAALRRAGKPYQRRPNELARDIVLTSGGMSNVLRRLQNAKLVRRIADPDDARSKYVQLTPAGLNSAEKAVRLATEAQARVLTAATDSDVRAAVDALRPLLLALAPNRR
jgi:DNA-binding MarR family transcriptional regulator